MTNAEIPEHGRKLFQSAENLRKSAASLQGMMDSLWEEIEKEEFFGECEDLGDEEITDSENWFTAAYARNAGILFRPARAPGQKGRLKDPNQIGTISIVARLCNSKDIDGELPDWPWLNQACLIVGWHPKQNPEGYWEIENFDPEDENMASIVHVGDGLWAWRESDGDYAYFFVLPIFALTGRKALEDFAVRPAKDLFDNGVSKSSVADAFGDVPVLLPNQ
jgi:hypothetical protein